MSHSISGDGTGYPVTFDIPDDGDGRDAASFNVAVEALADRTEHLKLRVVSGTSSVNTSSLTVVGSAAIGNDLVVTDDITCNVLDCSSIDASSAVETDGYMSAAGGYFRPSAQTITKAFLGPAEVYNSGGWELDANTNDFFWVTTSTNQRKLRIPLNAYLKNQANVTQLVVRFKGAPGHANLPGGMTEIVFYRKRIGTTGAASGIIQDEFDSSVNTTAYQAEHDITLTLGTPHTVNTSTHEYYLIIDSESGSDAIAGAEYHGGKITYEYNRVDEI